MSNTVKLLETKQEFIDFLNMPSSIYKNILYYKDIMSRHIIEANITYKDDCIYYSYTQSVIKKSNQGYYKQRTKKEGFTLKNGKLSIWYNKNIFELQGLIHILEHFKCNWLNNTLHPFITKSIAEKILTGKITNSLDVCKAYLKVMRFKNVSPKLFFEVIHKTHEPKQQLLRSMAAAKDINHYLEWRLDLYERKFNTEIPPYSNEYIISDMIQQALVLNEKIDFKWSAKRMNEEHSDWTKRIMDIEAAHMEDVTVESLLPFDKFNYPGFKLLTTQKDVYAEGKMMKHCVYTNYWTSILNGTYLAYSIDYNGERATLGVYKYEDDLIYNQCYSIGNSQVSAALKTTVNEFIEELKVFSLKNNLLNKKSVQVKV